MRPDSVANGYNSYSSHTGYLSAQLQLPPGTHHVKFIIDGEMQLSDELPTAVDYTNILVNYIEVSADDIPKKREGKVPDGIYPPQVIPEGTEAQDHEPAAVTPQICEGEAKATTVYWGREVPPYLEDFDKPQQVNRSTRANNAISDFAQPPGLPMMLAKSILNGTTPMKDDSSVLPMPNHTVLNHLATSSIKNDVLATSITTRYIRKVCIFHVKYHAELIERRSMLQPSFTNPQKTTDEQGGFFGFTHQSLPYRC